ncbi:solute carrier family 2, facilitated glucose transporter member 3-like [Microplitis mediator]|uniref:solute carrier family 2, facilitated glucose transporter member 3-like n=1 Tax=Microplitis mediator TaxID=375433 RepID=UPI0025537CCE|nr:solute carrier family 2, facilitated glucose transporter member 3-like [Microplitis mediator]
MTDTEATNLCLQKPKSLTLLNKRESPDEKENDGPEISKWTPLLILGGAVGCLGSAVPAGFNIGVVNNPADIIREFCNESIETRYGINLTEKGLNFTWSVVVSIFLIGGVVGSLVASIIADKYGRRNALAVGNVFGILGAVCFLLAPTLNSVEVIVLGRLLVGFSGGMATTLVPIYVMEISSLSQRGAVGVLCQLGITVGVFLGQVAGLDSVLGTKETWHIMFASFAPLCVISLILLYILPESPKYLYIIKREKEKATRELARIRHVSTSLLYNELRSLEKEAAMRTTLDTWSFGRIIRDPSVRLPLLLVASVQLGQQLSGINAIFYYSKKIFGAAQLGSTAAQLGILGTGIINILMAVISVRIMSYFGRRTLFLISSYASAICLFVLFIGLTTIKKSAVMPWVCIVSVQVYVLTYGLGMGPIPYFIGSELFDVSPRPTAMAIGSVCNWGGNFIVGLLFPTVVDALGPPTYLIFIFCIIIVAVFVKFYLPETRGVNTPDIVAQMSKGFRRRSTLNS